MSRGPLRWLVVAVVVLFAGTATLVVLLSRAAIELASADDAIANGSVPSIVALQTMRADVQQQHALVDEWVLGAPGDPAVRAAKMDALARELTVNRHAYLAQPRERGDRPIRRALESSLTRFESLLDRARAQPPGAGANASGVMYEVDAAVGEAGNALVRATDFSADQAEAAAGETLRVSRTLLPWAVVLEVLSVAAAAVTIALTYRAVHRADALADLSRVALEHKTDELEAFAGRVAHDLLSPLMTVGLGIDLAHRRDGALDAGTRAALSRASSTLQRVRGFVSDLLEFARAGAKPPPGVHTQVDEVVREVAAEFEPIAHNANVDLCIEEVPSCDVRCSPGVLTSLLSNLVQNAIKYVADSEVRRVVVRTRDLGNEIRVEVEDTGPGVPPSDQQRMFDPFVRGPGAAGPGIGLGLATVRHLAEAHGGHAGVRSEPGHGAVFWFSVPYAA